MCIRDSYNGNCRQLEMLNKYMNTITNSLQFTLETEMNNKINFLDLTLTKIHNKINFNIYRKPTTTDHAIHASSCHPFSHKMAFFNCMIHRLLALPLSTEDYKNELGIIKHIATAYGYKNHIVDRIINKKQNRPINIDVSKKK